MVWYGGQISANYVRGKGAATYLWAQTHPTAVAGAGAAFEGLFPGHPGNHLAGQITGAIKGSFEFIRDIGDP